MSFLSDLLGSAYHEGMTEDDISSALEAAGVGNGASEITKLKNLLSKANSEAASYKKQLRDKQTPDEAEVAAQKEAYDALVAERDGLLADKKTLQRTISIAEQTAKLVGIGYDSALATETATAMIDGDTAKVIENQSKVMEAVRKNAVADRLRGMQQPAPGASSGGVDYQKKIDEARASGDWAAVAYYTRVSEQDAQNQE